MDINSSFDGGNIKVLSAAKPSAIELEIVPDKNSDFYQWFYFRASGRRGENYGFVISNAGGAAYSGGFQQYKVVYSYDREHWLRHPTQFENGKLSFTFTLQQDIVYFAYFIPYSMERHHDLIASALRSSRFHYQCLGTTVDGQALDLLRISADSGTDKKNCWIIARQHPGETMAEWWMEGLIERLVDEQDEAVSALLSMANLFIVANMNPDGSRRGHLRTNAVGRNLNREWQSPCADNSPEVFVVKQAMAQSGVDFLLDVHGDETLPYCFIAGTEGLAGWTGQDQQRLDFYKNTLAELNPDFQTSEGYPAKAPGEANLTMSTAQTASNHGCLAMTLEMPFKDTTATSDPLHGWSTQRSKELAHSCMDALLICLKNGLLDKTWTASPLDTVTLFKPVSTHE